MSQERNREQERVPKTDIEKMHDQMLVPVNGDPDRKKYLNNEHLLFGLTILIKDMMEFLSVKAYRGDAVDHFRELYLQVMDEDRFYWLCYGNTLFVTLVEAGLPDGFTDMADRRIFDMSKIKGLQLEEEADVREETNEKPGFLRRMFGRKRAVAGVDDDEEVGEWLRYAGWSFLKKFSAANKDNIFEEYGLTAATSQSYHPNKDHVITLAQRLLSKVFDDKTFWYPLAMFLSVALISSKFVTVPKN